MVSSTLNVIARLSLAEGSGTLLNSSAVVPSSSQMVEDSFRSVWDDKRLFLSGSRSVLVTVVEVVGVEVRRSAFEEKSNWQMMFLFSHSEHAGLPLHLIL